MCCINKNIICINDTYTCINCGAIHDNIIENLEYPTTSYSWIPKGSKNYIYINGIKKLSDISIIHSNSLYNYKNKANNDIKNIYDNLLHITGYSVFILNNAKKNWELISNKNHRNGIRLGLIASCLYFACEGIKTSGEICDDLNISKSNFNKGIKIYKNYFPNTNINSFNLIGQYISILYKNHLISNNIINEFIIKCNNKYKNTNSILSLSPKSIIISIIYLTIIYDYNIILKKNLICKFYHISLPTLNKAINEYLKINCH